jgi:O-acetyl-ADP-ribose deacetylase (regulator of RNase III)
MRSLQLTRGDISRIAADVLIIPTRRSFGGHGAAAQVAKRLTKDFGFDPRLALAAELGSKNEVRPGEAVGLMPPPAARKLGCPAVVCTCVFDESGNATSVSVETATRAALDAVERLRAEGLVGTVEPNGKQTLCVAVPSLGTGTTAKLPSEDAARAMKKAITAWRRVPDKPRDELILTIWSPRTLWSFLSVFDELGANFGAGLDIDCSTPGKEGLQQFTSCLANRQAILFVGSGLSFNSLPPKSSWTDLFLPEWLEEFRVWDKEAKKFKLQSDVEIVDVAQIIADRLGKSALEEAFAKDLQEVRSRPSLLHYQLLDLPWSAILTTNYDTLIEDTLEALRIPHTVITHDEQIAGLDERRGVPVIKVHGGFCATDCDLHAESQRGVKHSRLITTRDEFDAYFANNPAMGAYLESKLLTSHGLIVGYSVRDPHMRQLFARIGSVGRRKSTQNRPGSRQRREHRARRLFWLTTDKCPIGPYWSQRGVEVVAAKRGGGNFRAVLADGATRAQRLRAHAQLSPEHLEDRVWDELLPEGTSLSSEQQQTLLRCLVEAGLSPPVSVLRRVMALDEAGDRDLDSLARLHHSPDTTSAFCLVGRSTNPGGSPSE